MTDTDRERAEAATVLAHGAWMELLAATPGNPLAVEVARWDGVVATVAAGAADQQWMQHTTGRFTPDVVDDVLAWFADRGIGPRFEIGPSDGFAAVAARLHAGGLHQSGFTDLLVGPALPPTGHVPAGVLVERLTPAPHPVFGRTLLLGHEVPDDAPAANWDAAGRFPTLGTHACFLARDEATGDALGAALLVPHAGVGFLANASTVPAARGRGVQTALIASRVAAAIDAGCDVVAALALPWSQSNRNLRRAGLAVAHTKVNWTPAPGLAS